MRKASRGAIPRCPEVQPRHPTLVKQLTMDPNHTLPVQEADRVRPQYWAGCSCTGGCGRASRALPPGRSRAVGTSPAGLCQYDHHVVLALPPDMGQALPFAHRLPLPAPRGLPGRRSLCRFRENARRIARSSCGNANTRQGASLTGHWLPQTSLSLERQRRLSNLDLHRGSLLHFRGTFV